MNDCIAIAGTKYTIPNCVGYAWGRFYEIIGEKPSLCTANAETWYDYNDGYSRGTEPVEGAVICWQCGKIGNDPEVSGNDEGHVAIVERVIRGKTLKDTKLIISESGYRDEVYDPEKSIVYGSSKYSNTNMQNWHFQIRQLEYNNGNWTTWSNYKFQGFIYPPKAAALSADKVVYEDNYLSKTVNPPCNDVETKMKPNVQYIWQFLGSRGWSKNAVAALCGNMHQESCMMPNQWEKPSLGSNSYYVTNYGAYESPKPEQSADGTYHPKQSAVNKIVDALGRSTNKVGYGLVQWTSFTKLVDWCNNPSENGTGRILPYYEIESQLERIAWEARNNKQWNQSYADYNYKGETFEGLTFAEFVTSKKDAGWLAAAFAFCYERPGSADNVPKRDSTGKIIKTVAEERYELATTRDSYATYWYNYLNTLSIIGFEDDSLKVSNFKIDFKKPLKMQFSMLIQNATSGTYTLKRGSTKIRQNVSLTGLKDGLKTVEIESDVLKPNAKYTLELSIKGKSDEDIYKKQLNFDIPQEYPEQVSKVTLKYENTSKVPDGSFTLSISKPNSLGYWGNTAHKSGGYEICLFVNGFKAGNKVDITTGIQNFVETFTLKDYFSYQPKIGDTVQVGVRTYINTDNTPIYDSDKYKTSEAILLLKTPIQTFLNI